MSESPAVPGTRRAWVDNLKVFTVAAVIVGHAIMAWSDIGNWVVREPPVRDPLLSALVMLSAVGVLFAMPLMFLLAGTFTPASFERKGFRRFLADRALRLGVPMLFFVIVLSPPIEFVDSDNLGWDRGFLAFIPVNWWPWPPTWGPTWFLAVLLAFSTVYGAVRHFRPRRPQRPVPLRAWHLVAAACAVALPSFVARFWVLLGEEEHRLALGQSPGWVIGFTLGVLGAERGWFDEIPTVLLDRIRHWAWGAAAGVVVIVGGAVAAGFDFERFAGRGTWESLLVVVLEGILVVTMPLWLMDLFRRRFDHQGRLGTLVSRGAFAAFVLHQAVLLGLVLLSRFVPWPPEVEWVVVSILAVVASFGLGAVVSRLPGIARVA